MTSTGKIFIRAHYILKIQNTLLNLCHTKSFPELNNLLLMTLKFKNNYTSH